jgi:hypothetical protein
MQCLKALVPQRRQFQTKSPTPTHTLRFSQHICHVKTESEVEATVGMIAPDFTLPDTITGNPITLSQYTQGAPATLIMVICNHCPFVIHLKDAILDLSRDYSPKAVKIIAISSNSIKTHPQDGPNNMKTFWGPKHATSSYYFPYCYDESQDVAKSYFAACTPEFYVFNKDMELYYHGQFDETRPSKYGGDTPAHGGDLRYALDAVLRGKVEVDKKVKPSIGCNIKWHPGNNPAWFHG